MDRPRAGFLLDRNAVLLDCRGFQALLAVPDADAARRGAYPLGASGAGKWSIRGDFAKENHGNQAKTCKNQAKTRQNEAKTDGSGAF